MNVERLGPYKVVGRIGAGGMGEVFKGVHVETGQVVALKILAVPEGEDTQLLKRFRREIVSASRLSHDNIVRLYDSGEQDEHIWYAMEFIDGCSLSELLSSPEALPVPKALSIAQDICKAFVYMHSRGFVHRDIKPGNIMVAKDGTAKLVDFGLVKSKFATNITVTGIVLGTPAFMSPEMLQGKDVDHRSDIFQLGQVLYKMLAGTSAFEGNNSFEVATNCVVGSPQPLIAKNPKVSPALEAVIFLCLEKKPEDRYQAAADLLNDLKRVEKGLKPAGTAKKSIPAALEARANQTAKLAVPPPPPPAPKSNPWPRLAAALLGVAIAAGAGYAIVSRQGAVYDARDVKIASGLRGARVTWTSESPYATRAIYSPVRSGEEPGQGYEVVNSQEGETTRHSLELKSLEPGTSYRLSIVYPDRGSSLPESFQTGNPALASSQWSFLPDGTPVLSFSTFVPAVATVRHGSATLQAAPGTYSTSHSATLTGADLFGEGSIQISCSNALGEQWSPPGLPAPDARALARELVKLLEQQRPRLLEKMAGFDKAERARKLDPALARDLLAKPVMEPLERFAPIGPIFFSSRKPSLDDKIALYDPLSLLDAIDRWCHRRKLPFDSKAAQILGPDFGPLPAPRLGDGETYRLESQTRLISSAVSAAQADMAVSFSKGAARVVSIPFTLRDAAEIKRAELTVKLHYSAVFTFEEEIGAAINQSLELALRRDPKLPAGENNFLVVHGFDPRALTEGANEIRLTLRPMPGLRAATEVDVREAILRVER